MRYEQYEELVWLVYKLLTLITCRGEPPCSTAEQTGTIGHVTADVEAMVITGSGAVLPVPARFTDFIRKRWKTIARDGVTSQIPSTVCAALLSTVRSVSPEGTRYGTTKYSYPLNSLTQNISLFLFCFDWYMYIDFVDWLFSVLLDNPTKITLLQMKGCICWPLLGDYKVFSWGPDLCMIMQRGWVFLRVSCLKLRQTMDSDWDDYF